MTRFALLLAIIAPGLLPAAEWVDISEPVTSRLKPGYAGPTAGVAVDRISGNVFMVVNDQGLWRSGDHGASFSRVDEENIGGRCETGWGLQVDPAGQRLFCFMVYGGSALSTDGGGTWTKSGLSHLDFGSVDWGDTGKRLLAVRHESGGVLATSRDGGDTWQDLDRGFNGCGVFDRSTFVATKHKEKGIFHSVDAGVTWALTSSNTPTAAVPVILDGIGYWAGGTNLLASRDHGETWTQLGTPVEANFGPYFSSSEQHFVVVGPGGFQETKDGGKTWRTAAPLPPGFGVARIGPSYAWDPEADIFYASAMGKATFKYQR